MSAKVEAQFRTLQSKLASKLPATLEREPMIPSQLRVGFVSAIPVDPVLQQAVGILSQAICQGGGTVILAGSLKGGGVLQVRRSGSSAFKNSISAADSFSLLHALYTIKDVLREGKDVDSTLGFGQRVSHPGRGHEFRAERLSGYCTHSHHKLLPAGLHIMGTSSMLPVELLTGLGATGVEVIVAVVRGETALAAHPLVPVLQVAVAAPEVPQFSLDLDVILRHPDGVTSTAGVSDDATASSWALQLAQVLAQCLSRSKARLPKLYRGPVSDFQLPRTAGSVSM